MLKSISQHLRLPEICSLCSLHSNDNSPVCKACQTLLKPIVARCPQCALPFNQASQLPCNQCQRNKPYFDQVWCAYQYEEPLRTLIHQFKYQGELALRRFFSQMMMESITHISPAQLGCLVPVPMHNKKLQQRGFNPAAILTKQLAKQLKIPYDLTLCRKIINTSAQAQLSRSDRQIAVRGSFSSHPHHYQTITLVDDLVTTGSTVNELARLIKGQTPCQVNVWCLARTNYSD